MNKKAKVVFSKTKLYHNLRYQGNKCGQRIGKRDAYKKVLNQLRLNGWERALVKAWLREVSA